MPAPRASLEEQIRDRILFYFFSSRRRHTRCSRDWSSDVCSSDLDTGEMYELVAVGGGISGLAAAIFFQKYQGGRALVIDNHAMFGGEAKRNEFLVEIGRASCRERV